MWPLSWNGREFAGSELYVFSVYREEKLFVQMVGMGRTRPHDAACRVGQDSSGKLFGPTSVAEVLLLMVNYFLNLVKKPLTSCEG